MTHSITLERARALLHALKRVPCAGERQAMAELAKLRFKWACRQARPRWRTWSTAQMQRHYGDVTPMGDGALFDSWEAK